MTKVHELANGVRVVADPVPGFQTLALTVAAGRGARSEGEAEAGVEGTSAGVAPSAAAGGVARVVEAEDAAAETRLAAGPLTVKGCPVFDGDAGRASPILLSLSPIELPRR